MIQWIAAFIGLTLVKKLLRSVILLIAFLVVGSFLLFQVGGKFIIAKVISDSMGVPVSVGELKIDLVNGMMGIHDLNIRNNKKFKEKSLAVISEIFVDMNPAALLRGVLHVEEIAVVLDHVTVERSAAGVNLLDLKAMKDLYEYREPPAGGYKPEPPRKQPPPMPSIKMRIDKLDLTVGRARYADYSGPQPVIKELNLGINHFVVRDLTSPAEVVQQIVKKIMSKLGLGVLGASLNTVTQQAQQKMQEMGAAVSGWFSKRFSS